MFRCDGCGRTFEEQKHYTESHGFEHPPFEEWDGCPFCGESRPTEVDACNGCGNFVDVDDLYFGLCADCLRKKCTYDAALDFMESHDLLGKFFFWMFNDGSEPQYVGQDLLDVFAEIYHRRKANDLLTNSHEWLDAVQEFILDSDGHFGKDEFANFLVETDGEQ